MPAYLPSDASVGIYNGRMYPWSIGDDVNEKYWHLRRAAMLYDVPETPMKFTGAGASIAQLRLYPRRQHAGGAGLLRHCV